MNLIGSKNADSLCMFFPIFLKCVREKHRTGSVWRRLWTESSHVGVTCKSSAGWFCSVVMEQQKTANGIDRGLFNMSSCYPGWLQNRWMFISEEVLNWIIITANNTFFFFKSWVFIVLFFTPLNFFSQNIPKLMPAIHLILWRYLIYKKSVIRRETNVSHDKSQPELMLVWNLAAGLAVAWLAAAVQLLFCPPGGSVLHKASLTSCLRVITLTSLWLLLLLPKESLANLHLIVVANLISFANYQAISML